MTNNDSRIHTLEWLQDSHGNDRDPRPFLEVRSGSSVRYLRPSRWERIRLRWAFRHFQILPLQLLNTRNRRLVLRLMQESPATDEKHVDKSNVFGIVETTRWQTTDAESAPATVHPAKMEAIRGKSALAREVSLPDSNLSDPEQRFVERFRIGQPSTTKNLQSIAPHVSLGEGVRSGPESSTEPQSWFSRGSRFFAESWFIRGLATPGAKILCFSVGGVALLVLAVALEDHHSAPATLSQPQTISQPSRPEQPPPANAPPVAQVRPPTPISVTMDKTEVLPSVSTPALESAANSAPAPPASEATQQPGAVAMPAGEASQTVASNLPPHHMVAELPKVRLVYPTLSDPRLTGELDLMAWIGADGAVTRVSVLTGDPRLAKSAIRAVQQWRYAPSPSPDHPEETVARIRMKFFGQDAVSIVPVADDQKSHAQN